MNVNYTPEQGKACLEIENAELRKENQRLNNVLNELRQFVIELYKVEYNQTSDWWLNEQLSSWYDDMNIATDFKLDDILSKRLNELKESDK